MQTWNANYQKSGKDLKGELSIANRHLIFRAENEVKLELDEFAVIAHLAKHRIFITSTLDEQITLMCSDISLKDALEKHLGIKVHSEKAVWLCKNQTIAEIGILIGLVAFGLLASHLIREQSAFLATFISHEHEIEIGEAAFKSQEGEVLQLPPENQEMWLNLVSRLTNLEDLKTKKWKVHINQDPEVNAMAFPGGNIIFTRGLIANARSPEEVLGVLAHELAHTVLRHQVQQMSSEYATGFFLYFFLGGAASSMSSGLDVLNELKFSRKHEQEADQIGLKYLADAKISARGLLDFFESNRTRNRDKETANWISSHPTDAERIAIVSTHVKTESGTVAVDFPLDKLKEAVRTASPAGKSH